VREDGSRRRRITFNPLGASRPLLLRDGRIVFAGGVLRHDGVSEALHTIFSDGTDVFPFTAEPPFPARAGAACETADGEVVFVESDLRDPPGGGHLVAVPVTRSRSERRSIGVSSGGRFLSPSPLPDGSLLVAWRGSGPSTYGIHRLDPEASAAPETVYDDAEREDLDPVAVLARLAPSGRSSAIRADRSAGELYCLDARRTDEAASLPRTIAYVDVFRGPDGGSAGEVLLERVPVEPDGSFHLRVPSETPLRLATVDASGERVREMRSFVWVMPKEKRGCIGCHVDPDVTPPNRLVEALRRPPRTVGLAGDAP
jgi:hypothetical protein